MNSKIFLDNFETLAHAPNGVQKLRELILQLAVHGKLVPQNPNDEPASVLLEKIKAEKEKLIKGGKVKKQLKLPPIKPDEISYELPEGWEWVRIADITRKLGSGSTPRGGRAIYKQSGVKFLRSQNVYNNGLRLDGVAYITTAIHNQMKGTALESGDLLLNITGASIARSCLVPDDFDEGNVRQHVAIVRPLNREMRHFLHLVLRLGWLL